MMKKLKLSWPQALLASVAIIAFAGVYILVSDTDRATIHAGILGVWAIVSTFLAPLLRKKFAHELEDGDGK